MPGVDADPLEASSASGRSVGMMPPASIFAVPRIGKLPLFQARQPATKALDGRFAHLHAQWAATKAKLPEKPLLRGPDFKPWPKDGPRRCSVRVDHNFRAHLQHLGDRRWIAYVPRPHTELGHG